MSRRDDRDRQRDFDSRRHRSRFDREPSPKRSRRDGKPETERVSRNRDVGDRIDKDQNKRRRLQDALPLEAATAPDSTAPTGSLNKEPDKKLDEQREGTKLSSEQGEGTKHSSEQHEGIKHSSEPTETPRSRSFYQHDECGNPAQDGRSYSRRAAPERGRWGNVKDPEFERGTKASDTRKDERPQFNGDSNGKWRRDKFPEVERDLRPPPPLPSRKRPAFSGRKIPADPENTEKEMNEPEKASRPDRSETSERMDDKERNPRHWDKHERVPGGDRVGSRDGAQRGVYLSRERNSGGGNYRGPDRFNGRQGYHPSGNHRVEKWKHDLFDEANKTSPPRNEEEQIAKLEALLAS